MLRRIAIVGAVTYTVQPGAAATAQIRVVAALPGDEFDLTRAARVAGIAA
ncbi:MAG TPA: hypothetical protein VJ717_20485 [Gemmatimonadaceae bacterium]|nr:hypothetical protein [Gemmatimonadaceae bacterium]